MNTKPIIVGVDGSPESVRAAVAGAMIAERLGADCTLVHAVPVAEYLAALPSEYTLNVDQITEAAIAGGRESVKASLEGNVPMSLLAGMVVQLGRAAVVIEDVARRRQAGLVVMGAKHHRGFDRLGGSAISHALRTLDVPMLLTNGTGPTIGRVLVAVDLSHAAQPAIEAAQAWAKLFGAQLRVMHVVEPVPIIAGVPVTVGDEEFFKSEKRLLELNVWPLLSDTTQTTIRRGLARREIAAEARKWKADLLVVGSHGKGWAHRLLIGSTTERLVHALPTMMLVVPVAKPVEHRGLGVEKLPWEEGVEAGTPIGV